MAAKKIQVGVWTYRNAEGKRRRAYFGEVVDLSDSEVERGLAAGVFGTSAAEPAPVLEVESVEVSDDAEPEPAPVLEVDEDEPVKPKRTAPKDAWIDYAVAQGIDRDEAEAQSRADLIEALA